MCFSFRNLAATMYAPGTDELAQDSHTTSTIVMELMVSLCVLGFAIGPVFLAPLYELYGRLIIYSFRHIFFFIRFIFGCAFSTNVGVFLAFRLIGGRAASGTMSIEGDYISDLYPLEVRGKAMSHSPWGFSSDLYVIFLESH
ncbi:hypothetical protein MAP00_004439 [Monascus purpureus]|nr:hypothetical protein MAP00_004439 [Monascus purpureus]